MNAQQLKNAILQEAIEGRLVPQDPNDEPASVLLDKIRKEKARLVKEGKLKKKDLEETPISEDEKSFYIPKHWGLVRLGEITYNHGQKTPTEDFSYIDIGSIDNEHQKLNMTDNIIKAKDAPSRARKIVKRGDVLYATVRPYLHNLCIIDRDFDKEPIASTGFAVLSCINGVYNKFLFYYLLSPIFDAYANDGDNAKGMAYPAINDKKLYNGIVPLPPLAEQKRIVAKIEELLPKVEEYGKAQEALDKLNEELPERLKKSILQEAIEGRLVPQDPNDEPASVLLDKIRKEKARLVKEGKLKKKDLEETPIEEDEKPFEIPNGWMWTRLGNHVSATSGLAYKKDDLAIYSNEYVRVLRGGNIFFGSWCIKDDDVMIGKQFVNDELILKKGMFISPAVTSLEHMGKTALIREDQKNIVAGGFVLMLIPHFNNETYWEYLNVLFQSGYYREKCKSITNKSGQAFFNLSRAKLLDLLIPLPPLAEQKRIVEKIEQLMKEINKLKV